MSYTKSFNHPYSSPLCLAIATIAISGCIQFEPQGVVSEPNEPWMPLHVSLDDVPTPRSSVTVQMGDFQLYDTDREVFEPGGSGPSPDNPARAIITQTDDMELLIWSLTELTIDTNATLRLEGSRPLAIVVDGPIDIKGLIDVSSPTAIALGAGSNRRDCDEPGEGIGDMGGSSGGGGGGFQGSGGAGGQGDSNDNNADGVPPGGAGGPAVALPQTVKGGCPGAEGGSVSNIILGSSSDAGQGGGAVELVSLVSIVISGSIQGGGGGAEGGQQLDGGGGGGSGGYIGLDAPLVTLDASTTLAANGGGGGEGGGTTNVGENGQHGHLSSNSASGGSGSAELGSNGGGGSSIDSLDGETVTEIASVGGGGGGGGAGYILIRARQLTDNGATISPPRTELPQ